MLAIYIGSYRYLRNRFAIVTEPVNPEEMKSVGIVRNPLVPRRFVAPANWIFAPCRIVDEKAYGAQVKFADEALHPKP